MSPRIAIVAPGEMGSAIAQVLIRHGAQVRTMLNGRSAASVDRALRVGFVSALDDADLVANADLLLSVVPPDAALAVAERLSPVLSSAGRKPVYVDCNAIAPATSLQIAEIMARSECPYVDACLFGGPTSGKPGVVLYACGPHAQALAPLGALGLDLRLLDGPIGAASAMKLVFSGINKGFTAVAAVMALAALRSGANAGLVTQLTESQPALLDYILRFVPAMFPKAGRWAPEMREIAAFLRADDPAASAVFESLEPVYAQLAELVATDDGQIAALADFCRAARAQRAA